MQSCFFQAVIKKLRDFRYQVFQNYYIFMKPYLIVQKIKVKLNTYETL